MHTVALTHREYGQVWAQDPDQHSPSGVDPDASDGSNAQKHKSENRQQGLSEEGHLESGDSQVSGHWELKRGCRRGGLRSLLVMAERCLRQK